MIILTLTVESGILIFRTSLREIRMLRQFFIQVFVVESFANSQLSPATRNSHLLISLVFTKIKLTTVIFARY